MESQLDHLRRRFEADAWLGKGTSVGRLSVRDLVPGGFDLAGWRAESVRHVNVEGRPPRLISVWRDTQGGPEALLSVEIFECDSVAEAHEFLLRMLAEFQSPQVERQTENAVGDVSFTVPGGGAVLLAYANLVILIRSAGR